MSNILLALKIISTVGFVGVYSVAVVQ